MFLYFVFLLLFICLSFHTCSDVFFWVFSRKTGTYWSRPSTSSCNFYVRSLRLGFVMYLGILLYMSILLYLCFVTNCQRGRLLGFEFVMLANHDKTWQKLSLISLEWSTLKLKTKNWCSGWKKKGVTICFVRLVLDRSKVAYQQNREPFFLVFKGYYKLTLGGVFKVFFLERLERILCLFCRSRVLYPKAL